MKEMEIPAKPRKYIREIIEKLRRGVLTFDHLSKRTTYVKPEIKN